MTTTYDKKAYRLAKKAGVFRARELEPHGIPRTVLSRLEEQGKIRRISRGLYEPVEADVSEHLDLMEVCKRVPHGIVCLVSALHYYGMTTQMPHKVWLAIDVKAYKPKIERPPVRIVRFSGEALTHGVQIHKIKGVELRITSPAKTVADCFKYRNKIGTDVAIEALKEYRRRYKRKLSDLWEAAEVCRVTKVITPYLEATA